MPIVVAGSTLSPAEAWRHEFVSALHARLDGAVDREWLDKLIAALYQLNADQDPRQAAEVAFVTLGFDLPSGDNQH
ncbi:hypothetical protein ASC78_18390 [Variovorax sp. Root318D1]|nr:hypothetical protein ASC78_18390 [Variovorax sp. Root318D1]